MSPTAPVTPSPSETDVCVCRSRYPFRRAGDLLESDKILREKDALIVDSVVVTGHRL